MKPVQRRGGLAVWRQIADQLARQIEEKQLSPGERLPTESALAQRFGVNRHTVRRAVSELTERGLVRVEQGRGSFVCHELIDYQLSSRTRFSENIRRNRQAPGGRLVATETLPADAALAARLGLQVSAPVLKIDSLRTADGVPAVVASSYFPAERFPDLAGAVARHGAITQALADYGVADYRRRETRVSARLAGRADARLLEIAEEAPVLVTDAVDEDLDGRAIQCVESRYPAERTQLTVEG